MLAAGLGHSGWEHAADSFASSSSSSASSIVYREQDPSDGAYEGIFAVLEPRKARQSYFCGTRLESDDTVNFVHTLNLEFQANELDSKTEKESVYKDSCADSSN